MVLNSGINEITIYTGVENEQPDEPAPTGSDGSLSGASFIELDDGTEVLYFPADGRRQQAVI